MSTMVFGASAAVVWQPRQTGSLICSGRAMYRLRPVAVSRSPTNSFMSGLLRSVCTTSTSQSDALSRKLVGFSVASLYEKSGYDFRITFRFSTAEYDGTDCGWNSNFIWFFSSGWIWLAV